MFQNPCKTLGYTKIMVYKISPVGEVKHIQPVALHVTLLVFLFFVLFSFFTSEIKTGMKYNTCFIVYCRSVCVDNHDIECI